MTEHESTAEEHRLAIDSMLASGAGIAARTDQMCRLIERFHRGDPALAAAAETALAFDMRQLNVALNHDVREFDHVQSAAMERMREAAKTAETRYTTAKAETGWKSDGQHARADMIARVRAYADAAQAEYHAGQHAVAPNARSRRAHWAVMSMLVTHTAENRRALELEANNADGPTDESLKGALEAGERAEAALQRVADARRRMLTIRPVGNAAGSIAQVMMEVAEELKNSQQDMSVDTIDAQANTRGETFMLVIIAYVDDEAEEVRVKLTSDPYPAGTDQNVGEEHAEAMIEYAVNLHHNGDTETAEVIWASAQHTQRMARMGLQCLDTERLQTTVMGMINSRRIGRATGQEIMRAIFAGDRWTADATIEAMGISQIVPLNAAYAIAATGAEYNIEPDAMRVLAQAMGYGSDQLGQPAQAPDREQAAIMARLLADAEGPEATSVRTIEAMGIGPPLSEKLIEDARAEAERTRNTGNLLAGSRLARI